MKPGSWTARRVGGVAGCVLMVSSLALVPGPIRAQEIMVLGTPHLGGLSPAPSDVQVEAVLEALGSFAPTQVCAEAMDGRLIEELAREPDRYGALLRGFASGVVELAAGQQLRLGITSGAARVELAGGGEPDRGPDHDHGPDPDPDPDPARALRTLGLHLAAHDLPSAVLAWSRLDAATRLSASAALGEEAARVVEARAASAGEVWRVAVPLARRLGLERICAVDSFVDELAVLGLAGELAPILADPEVLRGLESFNAGSDARWEERSAAPGGFRELLNWYAGDAFSEADRGSQWEVFTALPGAGHQRLMLWHARNAHIASGLFRALARSPEERVLFLVGAAHRPFVEDLLRSQPWLTVVPATSVLATPPAEGPP